VIATSDPIIEIAHYIHWPDS